MKDIGKYLEETALANGMTIAGVTSDAGVKANYIWRLKNGKIKNPKMRTLRALTEAARGVWDVITELWDGEDGKPPHADRDTFNALAETLTDEEVPDAIAAIQRMRTSRRRQRKPRDPNDSA